MFSSFLKITLRNLYREKMYALINIVGLSIAVASCLILGLYLHSELTYDQHHEKYKQIFRIITTNTFGNTPQSLSVLPPLLAKDYPEIKAFVRFSGVGMGESLFRHGELAFAWKSVVYADDNVFDVFTHDIIYGDPKTALVEPSSIAVSRTFSRKYFGDANPVGENISLNDKTYKITLVFADLPENTSLKYDVLLSYHEKELADKKSNVGPVTMLDCLAYLLMPEGYQAASFDPISDSINSRYFAQEGLPLDNKFWLQPLKDVHFNSDIMELNTANKFYIYGFSIVAAFILIVACINYMNLATARAAKRSKEVGMRKNLGAGRIGLGFQFLGEAVFFSLIALFIGLALVEIILNMTPINDVLGKHLSLNPGHRPGLFFRMILFGIGTGLAAGSYPALYLSSMPALSSLTNSYRSGKSGIRFRQVLVLIQFTITICVIACTLLMALQMRYVSRKPLGFEKENRLIITLKGTDLTSKIPTIKKELIKNNHILGITQSNTKMGQGTAMIARIGTNDSEPEKMSFMLVDDNFFKVMGMQIVSGRDFSKKLLTDINVSVVVNEAMVKKKGWDEPLGQLLMSNRVIGVVKDFHFATLHSPVGPLGIMRLSESNLNADFMRQLILQISREDLSQTLSFLEEKFAEFDPGHPFQYEFLDDSLDKLYISEQRLMKLIGSFGGICILISCLGLLGLSAYTTEQRTKEIGVRKVLGASTWQIIHMLFRNILFLVLGGAVVASLIAYYAMDEWLSSFAYRTGINPIVFLVSAILAAGVAFITVALQSYRTA